MRWSSRLIATASLLAVVIPLAGGMRARAQPGNGRTLYVVFLPGLCGWPERDVHCEGRIDAAARAEATFAVLRTELATAGVIYTPVYYSYSLGHPKHYTAADTRQSIDRSVSALQRQIDGLERRDPSASFDLVGYSLGGVVAASWVVTWGRADNLLRAVHSVVTFDSPLRGVEQPFVASIIAHLVGGGVWDSLRPDSATIREIVAFHRRWWQRHGHLRSVANTADLFVPPQEATLGYAHIVTDVNCPRDLFTLRSCHGAVMGDTALNRWVACHWITSSQQCVTPTPTSPPTQSPTPTSSPTPTATPTPLPPPPIKTPTVILPTPPTIGPSPSITPVGTATPIP